MASWGAACCPSQCAPCAQLPYSPLASAGCPWSCQPPLLALNALKTDTHPSGPWPPSELCMPPETPARPPAAAKHGMIYKNTRTKQLVLQLPPSTAHPGSCTLKLRHQPFAGHEQHNSMGYGRLHPPVPHPSQPPLRPPPPQGCPCLQSPTSPVHSTWSRHGPAQQQWRSPPLGRSP